MTQVAKLFKNGRSQAVRLPANLRFDCKEVFIRKDIDTGDIILSKKPGNWADYFLMLDSLEIPDGFMDDRQQDKPQERDLF